MNEVMYEERCNQSTILAQTRERNCKCGGVTMEVALKYGLQG